MRWNSVLQKFRASSFFKGPGIFCLFWCLRGIPNRVARKTGTKIFSSAEGTFSFGLLSNKSGCTEEVMNKINTCLATGKIFANQEGKMGGRAEYSFVA
ncbi:MAG: hypothetical protein AB1652_02120 [Bacillota bacterium]